MQIPFGTRTGRKNGKYGRPGVNILMALLTDFEKHQQTTKSMQNYPEGKEGLFTFISLDKSADFVCIA